MITDLNKIRMLGVKNADSNFNFRAFLKRKDIIKTDKIVHELYKEYAAKIDCMQCGNCCSELKVSLDNADIVKISSFLGISLSDCKKAYIEKNEFGELILNQLPCSFLKDKKCSIYNSRPKECASFPHLHKKDFSTRLFDVIDNYSVCPIVFNVYEDLKKRMNFR